MRTHDAVIIGGGPAGLAAAVELKRQGIEDILIIEREKHLGGILRQCIHDGFGLTRFGVTLSGPEYSQRFIDMAHELGVETMTDATVIDLSGDKVITAATKKGLLQVQGKAVILTMGCRERTRGALAIPGSRPAGVYNAGVTQSYVNLYNTMVGKEVVILGSGDIGLIMARRLTLEGAHVKAVLEIMPYPSGLPRNIEQCLNDYDIPLYLSHTVSSIVGDERIEGVRVVKVDEKLRPIEGSEEYFSCDTLILSVGLIPENEISLAAGVELDWHTNGAIVDEYYQSNVPGIFAAGNVLHVHDLVDFVSKEAEAMAKGAAEYIKNDGLPACALEVKPSADIGHLVPQRVSGRNDFKLSLSVRRPWGRCRLEVRQGEKLLKSMKLNRAIPAEMIELVVPAAEMTTDCDLEVLVYEA
ncbi:MAG: FAD-dependent oxidoreductase [Clostridia bacterium]|nr:FAD-dependent oxidoreductase [Clostridia bacterium]